MSFFRVFIPFSGGHIHVEEIGAEEGIFLGDDITPRLPDTSEIVHISGLALMKMIRHASSGVPYEVLGLLLGTVVDEYNLRVVDILPMPSKRSSTAVEDIDPSFQTKMMELLAMTGRTEKLVGWFHSHPGHDCFLSPQDAITEIDFEKIEARAIALVIDPLKTAKGLNPLFIDLKS